MQNRLPAICRFGALLTLIAGVTACGVSKQEAPGFTGPSGLAQSMTLTATPDRLPSDGRSQSIVTIAMLNDAGQPLSGQTVNLAALPAAATLSQTQVFTGTDGRAAVTVTAPPSSVPSNGQIQIQATPVGGVTRTVAIVLTGQSNTGAPVVSFTFSPAAPEVFEPVLFDASATTDEGRACGTACTYQWDFGDGSSQGTSNPLVTKVYSSIGTYIVKLTVTDSAGTSSSLQQPVIVKAVPPPTVKAPTFSPSSPIINQQVAFAEDAAAAPGHQIEKYVWDFGDGTSTTTNGPTTTHIYTTVGAYAVTVTVTDDLDQSSVAVVFVNVALPAPTPAPAP